MARITVTVCDRCDGRDAKEKGLRIVGTTTRDLCADCVQELLLWLRPATKDLLKANPTREMEERLRTISTEYETQLGKIRADADALLVQFNEGQFPDVLQARLRDLIGLTNKQKVISI